MGLDARVRYTKMVIKQGLIKLLEDGPINRVTVKAICEEAEINRATFYRYYADPYDLLEQLEDELVEGLRRAMQESLDRGTESTLVQILETMREHADVYRLLTAHGSPDLSLKVFRTCYGATADFIAQRHPGLPEERRAWLYSYVAQGASGVLDCWIAEGMVDDAEAVADFMERLIESSLTAV